MLLESVISVLRNENRSAVILANVNLKGRQIDFLIGLSQTTLLIDAKRSSTALQGQIDGRWQRKTAGGWARQTGQAPRRQQRADAS